MEPANVTQMTLFAYNQEERNAWTPSLAGRPSPLPYWSELAAVTRVLTRPLGFKGGGVGGVGSRTSTGEGTVSVYRHSWKLTDIY